MPDWLWIDAGPVRVWSAATLVLLYVALCTALARSRRRRQDSFHSILASSAQPPLLVAFASQTGCAEEIAQQTATALQSAGIATTLAPLSALGSAQLRKTERALFVVSTTGEGDAPDGATAFISRFMTNGTATGPALTSLRFGLLALGDREYRNFCAFGRRLNDWLGRHGAQPLFDAVEMDNGDTTALARWRRHLDTLTAGATTRWQQPVYDSWRLAGRTLANPASAGQPTFYISLAPLDPARAAHWQAGDLIEIRPRHGTERVVQFLEAAQLGGHETVQLQGRSVRLAEVVARSILPSPSAGAHPQVLAESLAPLPKREFSIASLPADGRVELLVRQARMDDGTPGLASGWLTEHAWLDARLEARIRSHGAFHSPDDARPLIFICNGTGIAGIRPHLKARAAAGRGPNWLIFGERSAASDFYYRDDIDLWRRNGVLTRLDCAFSRDQQTKIYVQHKLLQASATVCEWLHKGAGIYVCGSRDGMEPGVRSALEEIVGADEVLRLIEAGLYRRDVY